MKQEYQQIKEEQSKRNYKRQKSPKSLNVGPKNWSIGSCKMMEKDNLSS